MKVAAVILIALIGIGIAIFTFSRLARFQKKHAPYDWRADPKVWEYHRNELARIYAELGKTPRDVIAKQGSVERRKLLDALQVMCSWKRLNNVSLNDLEEFIVICTGLGIEVNNGGFHQYFFNSAADDWEVMLDGMRKAGDQGGVKRFEAVLARFPGGKPSKIRAERWKQLDTFADDQYKIFDSDTTAFFDHPFPDWEKIWQYIVANIGRIEQLPLKPHAPTDDTRR